MLDLVEEKLPIGPEEWSMVATAHSGRWPQTRRTEESIRRKFQLLYRNKMETGNPSCPPAVSRAKHIRKMILEKADCSGGEEEYDLDVQDDEEEDDDSIKSHPNNEGATAEAGVVIENMPETSPASDSQPQATVARSQQSSQKKRKFASMTVRKKRSSISSDDDASSSMKAYFQMMMVDREMEKKEEKAHREILLQEERTRREEERARREEERARREEERARREEERAKREEEERARREEERAQREEDRREERAQREEDRREEREQRNQQTMMMMTMLSAAIGGRRFNSITGEHENSQVNTDNK